MRPRTGIATAIAVLLLATSAAAQDPPPRIGPVVIDLRGILPKFPDSLPLAQSRGIDQSALPGRGIGVEAGAHVFPVKVGIVTIGIGGRLTLARSQGGGGQALNPSVAGHLTELASELSLNFGTGDGWSYLSGGLGSSRWSIVPDGSQPQLADDSWVRTFNYGGGARWFAKPHLAFHLDVRVHAVDPGPAQLQLPGSPRMTLLIIGAGLSIK
jgi:hypothetical protein